jgi:hypothetical protein
MPPSWPHFHFSHAQQSVNLQWILCQVRFRIATPPGAQQRRSLSTATAATHLIMPVPPQPQSSAALAILQLQRNFFLPDHADEIHKCLSAYEMEKTAVSRELNPPRSQT